MKSITDLNEWRRYRQQMKAAGKILGFVPTMGALHAGHLSLIEQSKQDNDHTLVSIFVNPTQFNNKEDLEKYPRTIEEDMRALESIGADYVLLPRQQDLYADNYRFKVTESPLSQKLCGAHRPGHFDGVLTVVMKLLNIAQAERCYLGEKDYQQFMLVREMAQTFFVSTEIVPCPVVRESDGLAMSSRNVRLSSTAREKAPFIYKAIKESKSAQEARERLEAAGFNVDYVEEMWGRRFVAATLEGVRLIDNVQC